MEQRKKGNKSPFFRNSSHKGDHNYRYFPKRSDKVRAIHNVQEAKTMDDMGISVPRIYAALDNNQPEFQLHVIEVEGMINNHAFTILIDS
jgi:hypothetical protein